MPNVNDKMQHGLHTGRAAYARHVNNLVVYPGKMQYGKTEIVCTACGPGRSRTVFGSNAIKPIPNPNPNANPWPTSIYGRCPEKKTAFFFF